MNTFPSIFESHINIFKIPSTFRLMKSQIIDTLHSYTYRYIHVSLNERLNVDCVLLEGDGLTDSLIFDKVLPVMLVINESLIVTN